jgi:hypothetical protein
VLNFDLIFIVIRTMKGRKRVDLMFQEEFVNFSSRNVVFIQRN